jgi:hypothetical protein
VTTQGEYDVFISHASEDKADFVEPLVESLLKLGLKVWYDDFSLDLGDSLRENIDRGLESSTYGVVILSPAFFAKRWTARELNGLVQKAIGEGRKVILPVWHGVTQKEVSAYSLPLSDLLAAHSEEGVDVVAEKIARVVRGGGGAADERDINRSHQLTEQRLLASAKRIIADLTKTVGVHELADALARDAFTHLESCYGGAISQTADIDVADLYRNYRDIMGSTGAFCALAANLGHSAHFPSVCRVAAIVTRNPGPIAGTKLDDGLWQYPSAFLLYVIGLSALQQSRLILIRDVLHGVHHVLHPSGNRVCLVDYVRLDLISKHVGNICRPKDNTRYKTPLSEHFFSETRELLTTYFVDDMEFDHIFNLFEYSLGLAFCSSRQRSGYSMWVPPGRYMWKNSRQEGLIVKLHEELASLGAVDILFYGDTNQSDSAFRFIQKSSQSFAW